MNSPGFTGVRRIYSFRRNPNVVQRSCACNVGVEPALGFRENIAIFLSRISFGANHISPLRGQLNNNKMPCCINSKALLVTKAIIA